MLIVFFRAIILYIVIVFCIRLMGKRQLGELQPSELVVTILLSNIATLPIEDTDIPVMMGLVPIFTIVCIDVFFSFFSMKSRRFRRILCGSPKIIISGGKPDISVMRKLRFSVDDLFEALRAQAVFDISEVQLAVVETTGQISVYVKPTSQPLTPKTADGRVCDLDPPQLIVNDGEIIEKAAALAGVSRQWIYGVLEKEKCKLQNAFIMTCDCEKNYTLIRKDGG